MKLTRIAVEGVGRFATRTVVEGLGPGLNVLAADNEAGKSTLFRAVRTCLFSRHTSKDGSIRELATMNRELAVRITVGFEADGAAWEIAKSFVRTPRAALTRNGQPFAEGEAADEKVWALMGLAPGSGRSGGADPAAYGLVWVEQGMSFHAPTVSEGAAGALSAAIQEEVGTLVGGERARRVLADLDEALDRELTGKGQPKARGELANAEAAEAEAVAALSAAREKLRLLDDRLDRLGKLRADLARENDPAAVRAMEAAAEASAQALTRMRAAESEVRKAQTAEAQARQLLDAARTALRDAQDRARRIDAAEERLADLSAGIAAEAQREAEQRTELARLAREKKALDERLAALEGEDGKLRRLGEAAAAAQRRDATARRIEALREAGDALARRLAELNANPATERALGDLDTVMRDRETLEAQIAAAATVAAITAAGEARVTVDGAPVAGERTLAITEATVIEAPGVVIVLTPPIRNEAAARQRRRALETRLHNLLAQHGAATVAALREMGAARRVLDQNVATARAALTGFGVDERTLPDELARERDCLAAIDRRVTEALAEAGADALPAVEATEARRKAGDEERAQLGASRAALEGQIGAVNARLQELAGRLGVLGGEKGQMQSQLEGELAALPHAARPGELQRLTDAEAASAKDHARATEALEAVRQTAPDAAAIERAAIDARRYAEARDNHRTHLSDLRDTIAHLEGQIEAHGGDGLGERVAELEEQHALAAAGHARVRHRIETLRLLRDTVQAAYAERREQINAPLRRHLAPFLHDLFPAAELDIGEGFTVAGLTRTDSEDINRLSGGTREQIAVLVRLAMAALLAERGRAAPVILDDALVYCDDERIEQMFTALNRAGQNQQVIVLTCRARAFQTLGGRPLSLAPG